ncbi:MAG: hypothetical protein IAF58_14450 [Leptolyngbya sp.]|nr:hypothetical protein [Candidatus Melainabacteria bacterium]
MSTSTLFMPNSELLKVAITLAEDVPSMLRGSSPLDARATKQDKRMLSECAEREQVLFFPARAEVAMPESAAPISLVSRLSSVSSNLWWEKLST